MKNSILVLVLAAIFIVFIFVKNKKASALSDANQVDKKHMEDLVLNTWQGWIELKNDDDQTILIGKITSKHHDNLYFGYGYLIKENLNSLFFNDVQTLSPFIDSNGKTLIKFGIDAQAFNVFKESSQSDTDRASLARFLASDKKINTISVWMSSHELSLPKKQSELDQFSSLWNEAAPLIKN